jgi:hypothetical protein
MGDLNTLSRSSVTLTGCYHCTRGRRDVLPLSDINVDRASGGLSDATSGGLPRIWPDVRICCN